MHLSSKQKGTKCLGNTGFGVQENFSDRRTKTKLKQRMAQVILQPAIGL